MRKHTLIIKKNDCMGCHACEVACKQEHGLEVGPRLIQVIEKSPDYVPVYCRHCAKPPCGEACPVDAISRNDRGIVLIDDDLCIGCRECVDACPFGAMQFSYRSEVAVKCDFCLDRLDAGRKPACLSVCPTGCIQLGGVQNVAEVFERAPTS
jgi:Fe-S-cluster-containing dehydrogenase component